MHQNVMGSYNRLGEKMIYIYEQNERMKRVRILLHANALLKQTEVVDGDVIVCASMTEEVKAILSKCRNCSVFTSFTCTCLHPSNKVYPYLEEDILLKKNAKLTAIGILLLLNKEEVNYTSVDIIGSGRCGVAIYELLKDVYDVRLISRQNHAEYISLESYQKMDKANVIVNTSPVYQCLGTQAECALFIDISSKGVYVNKDWKQVVFPGSLPNVYTPQSSAILICDYIRRVLDGKDIICD